MRQSTASGQGRLSPIVRAAAIEVASPRPALSEPVTVPASTELADAKALRELLLVLGRQVEELRGRRRQMIGDMAGLCVELGVTLAERLLCADIAANRQRLDLIVRLALERLPATSSVTVRGHPADIDLLERQLADDEAMQSVSETLALRRDCALARGQLKLEAGEFFVAWNTASSLAELRTALLDESFAGG